jgi:hypothetical protein
VSCIDIYIPGIEDDGGGVYLEVGGSAAVPTSTGGYASKTSILGVDPVSVRTTDAAAKAAR